MECQVCKTVPIEKYCPNCHTKICGDLPKNFLAKHTAMQRMIYITNLDNNRTTKVSVVGFGEVRKVLNDLF